MRRVALIIATAFIGTAVAVAHADEKSAPMDDATLQKETERCLKLPVDQRLKDHGCEAVSMEKERRFFNAAPAYTPVPVNPFPSVPDGPFKPSTPNRSKTSTSQ